MLKRIGSLILSIVLITGFMLSVTTRHAHAYIDLGSGSFLIQILLGTFFASLFAIKVWWGRITGQISRLFSRMNVLKKPPNAKS